MRYGVFGLSILALASCSKAPEHSESSQITTTDVAVPTSESAPGGIAITAAPGVAFAYHYGFRLPSGAIAAAQETHAAACEKLGPARCRITGMRYRLLGENDVEAMLAFKLDPAIARGFGKSGIAAIEAAKGTLVDAQITGTDAAEKIDRLAAGRAQAADELKRIDAELARPGRSASERAELQSQRAEIVRQIAGATSEVAEQRDSLANTPMQFDYGSGPAIRGFDASAPLTSALDTALGSAQVTLAVLLGALAIFGPPALALLVAWLLWRRFGKHLPWRRQPAV